MSEDLLIELRGGEMHVTLNRPLDGNGVSNPMAGELAQLLRTARDSAHLVVLRGSGADFCTGRAALPPQPAGGVPAPVEALARRRSTEVIFDCYQSFRDCDVPVVGIIQGRALGFGCSLAALCDITLASDAATFQIPEMDHNIVPTMVMSALVDRVAQKHVEYLVLTRETIDAQMAFAMGIVSRVVPADRLETVAAGILDRLAAVPKSGLLGVKEYTRVAYDMPLRGAIDLARNLHAAVNSSVSEMREPSDPRRPGVQP